jgi:spore photoproduct lyase
MESMSELAKSYYPNTIYVHESAKEDLLTKRILSRLPEAKVIEISEGGDPLSAISKAAANSTESERFDSGKRTLLLTRHLGSWLRSCPGTSQHVCCNLWTVNPGEGCPLDCTYCYLQSYLRRNPTLKIYTNTESMLAEIEKKAGEHPERFFRIGTGEVIDSLVWDELTDSTLELIPFFARVPNITLELKTKTATVSNLLKLSSEHNGKTVVSWSVNANKITESDEAFTASLEERISAAEKLCAVGYRVGFHFDPLIHFEGWEDAYRDTVKYIFSRISPEHVAWVSVSSLRYKPEMQDVMVERFPKSAIPFGEQFLAKDGKLRYFQPLRLKMINFVWNELKSVSAELPVYMCMESSTAWRTIAGGAPVAGSELVEIFSRKKSQLATQESQTITANKISTI